MRVNILRRMNPTLKLMANASYFLNIVYNCLSACGWIRRNE
jgi:hypothetical protein